MGPSRKKRWLFTLLAVSGTLALVDALVMATGLLVPAEFHDRQVTLFGLFEPDPELGFRTRPNLHHFEVAWMGNSLHAAYDTDEYGFRNVGRDYGDSKIFFVGDSFTWGAWLPREKTFPDLVSQQLGVTISNLGQESYYIEQYEKVIHRYLSKGHPKYLALCIFANDLTTPMSDDDLSHFYERFGWDKYRSLPFFERSLLYRTGKVLFDRVGRIASSRAGGPAPASHLDRQTTLGGVELYRQLGVHPYYFSEAYHLNTEEVYRRILHYVLDRGVTPVVFLLPSKESAYRQEYEELFPGDYLLLEETGYERLFAIAASLRVTCVDLTTAFRLETRMKDTYFPRDPHWNQEGHQLAAAEMVKYFDFPPRVDK